MRHLLTLRAWFIASAVLFAAASYRCWLSWPIMPLDVSAKDPETLSAFNEAVASHVMGHVGVALLGAGAVLVLGLLGLLIKGAAKVRAGH